MWKNKKNRKPLIINGARQVGKTWLMKEFGRLEYENTVYINMDRNPIAAKIFEGNYDIKRIIRELEIYSDKKIDSSNTLIILDEIQEVPTALSSLKYFYENAPEYNIVCAGSLLGIALHEGISFPVGKTDSIALYPLSFKEFLIALGNDSLASVIDDREYDILSSFNSRYIELLKTYYYVGGMPEVVDSYINDKDFNLVREIQNRILADYENDFSKHAPSNIVPRIRGLWHSIPSQIAKKNKKFIYGLIKEGARAREYEEALMWLSDCGLVYKVSRCSKPLLPLRFYEDLKAFKLYIVDVGLLGAMTGLSAEAIIQGNDIFTSFKGALTEEYALMQLKSETSLNIYYYTNDKSTLEIDFLLDNGSRVVPLEIKAEENLKAKSLKSFIDKNGVKLAVRSSMADYKKEEVILNLPLYAISNIENELK